MRLAPIDRPPTLRGRFAYRAARRRVGKVTAPLKTVFARVPRSLKMVREMSSVINGLTLDRELKYLIQSLISQINGCGYSLDAARAGALRRGIGVEKFEDLSGYRTSDLFDARERAALAYIEAATRSKSVSDETYDELRSYFGDREIAEITLLNALENFYNLVNLPLEIGSEELTAIAAEKTGSGGSILESDGG